MSRMLEIAFPSLHVTCQSLFEVEAKLTGPRGAYGCD